MKSEYVEMENRPVTEWMPNTLFSNGNEIPMNDTYFEELKDCTHLIEKPRELQEFYNQNNYVFFKNFFKPNTVLDIRSKYLSLFNAENETLQHGVKGHPAYDFVRSQDFFNFVNDPKLKDAAQRIFGEGANLMNRKILRHFTRHKIISSRAHIDHSYLDKGSKNVISAWIPIGDTPLLVGGLVYLKDSHRLNFNELKSAFPQFKDKFWITDNLKELSDLTKKKWMYTNYQAGDVIFHSSTIVHASLDCRSDYMRISTDIRFIPNSEPIDERWLGEWSADDGY